MYIIKAQLHHFRFNTTIQQGPFWVTLYKLSESPEEVEGVCMDHQELTKLTNYLANNPMNFTNVNYHPCDPEYTPEMTEYDLLPQQSRMPKHLFIRKENKRLRPSDGSVSSWMEAELLKENGSNISLFALPFDLVARIDD